MEKSLKEWVSILLNVLINQDSPSFWIEQERENGNLGFFFPELYECFGVKQNSFHKYDLYYHLLYSCDHAVKKLNVRLAALMHDIGKVETKSFMENDNDYVFYKHELVGAKKAYKIMKKWDLDDNLIKNVVRLIRFHMFHYKEYWTDSAVRRFINKVGIDNIEDLFYLRVSDREGNGFRRGEPQKLKLFRNRIFSVIEEEKKFKIKDLDISGNDIMSLGISEGPMVGEVLKYLYEKVINGDVQNNKDKLIILAESFISNCYLK